jgi:hypothetical protein
MSRFMRTYKVLSFYTSAWHHHRIYALKHIIRTRSEESNHTAIASSINNDSHLLFFGATTSFTQNNEL